MANSKKINVLSLAKFQAVLLALIGVIAGIFYSFGGAIYDMLTTGLNLGTALAFMALIGMPILFAIVGFILGLLEAILFNIFAPFLMGIETNISQ